MHVQRRVITFLFATVIFGGESLFPSMARANATITLINGDGASEGFNDPAPADAASTTGGNAGATLGEQRVNAFEFAAALWGAFLQSNVVIRVAAKMDPQACDATTATLGSAGADHLLRDFSGAALANTWYPAALGDSQARTDLSPGDDDINATFNSVIGTVDCAFPVTWYYGLDGNPPGGTVDFVQVVLHELAHGLGFSTFVALTTGAKLQGRDDVYMRNLEDHSTGKSYPDMSDAERVTASKGSGDLHWTGANVVKDGAVLTAGRHVPSGHVEMHAPDPEEPGSSVSHFAKALTPNELMEPSLTAMGLDVGLALSLMEDLGWRVTSVGFLPAIFWFLLDDN